MKRAFFLLNAASAVVKLAVIPRVHLASSVTLPHKQLKYPTLRNFEGTSDLLSEVTSLSTIQSYVPNVALY